MPTFKGRVEVEGGGNGKGRRGKRKGGVR